jgi:hypothetical protein
MIHILDNFAAVFSGGTGKNWLGPRDYEGSTLPAFKKTIDKDKK